jgi:hypothetical protein
MAASGRHARFWQKIRYRAYTRAVRVPTTLSMLSAALVAAMTSLPPLALADPPKHKAAVQKAASTGSVVATYPGFTMLPDGGSRIFVQLSSAVDVQEQKSKGELAYWLKGASVPVHNNRNPLLTKHFNTPVVRAQLAPVRGGVRLLIALRATAAPVHRVRPIEGGGAVLEIDFPAGKYAVEPPSASPSGDEQAPDGPPPTIESPPAGSSSPAGDPSAP